jgi:hypothetical protein
MSTLISIGRLVSLGGLARLEHLERRVAAQSVTTGTGLRQNLERPDRTSFYVSCQNVGHSLREIIPT